MEESQHPKRDLLVERGYEESTVFESPDYDSAIIGVDSYGRVIYDFEKMVECLKEEGMTDEEAIEFIEYNTVRALPYIPDHPHILYRIDDYEPERLSLWKRIRMWLKRVLNRIRSI